VAENGTLEQLQQYHRLLLAEHHRRNPVGAFNHDGALEQLLAKLDEMEVRLRADPNYVEPGPKEAEENRRALDEWFQSYVARR
jgi:hypothetical protein